MIYIYTWPKKRTMNTGGEETTKHGDINTESMLGCVCVFTFYVGHEDVMDITLLAPRRT